MQRIIYIKNYENKKIGDLDFLSNNIAHGLIENGIAELYSESNSVLGYEDKMMRPEIPSKTRNRYRIK